MKCMIRTTDSYTTATLLQIQSTPQEVKAIVRTKDSKKEIPYSDIVYYDDPENLTTQINLLA